MACGSITSWPEMYQKIFTHLKPGSGWIEHVEIDLEPRCDDGTLSPDSHLTQWYNYLADATARVDRPVAYDHRTRQLLQAAGFIDIQETIIRAPYNSWPADPHQRDIGRWYNLGLTEGLEALSAAPFTRLNRWNMNEHVKPLVEAVRREVTALIPCSIATSGLPADQDNDGSQTMDSSPVSDITHPTGAVCIVRFCSAPVLLGPLRSRAFRGTHISYYARPRDLVDVVVPPIATNAVRLYALNSYHITAVLGADKGHAYA
ncbi:uncharacterized protein N0V89_002643 [Didymosphaeria variabile]|uniref:Uncharacterized protein n=1 Tax=Didymosphaeria variabile TaxID=1932322 RepID=A0A9W8XT32_9PLEO|nr:uncharacterized protein N0V89_002643 [Didymosphaeria variabile]KAJ4358064.1 hypothetical protein N0V89_002643 [Didymosphaeria variabile]